MMFRSTALITTILKETVLDLNSPAKKNLKSHATSCFVKGAKGGSANWPRLSKPLASPTMLNPETMKREEGFKGESQLWAGRAGVTSEGGGQLGDECLGCFLGVETDALDVFYEFGKANPGANFDYLSENKEAYLRFCEA
uniref:Uncharacterized protein n=1 Tax=Cannabis sativa TaxID=3483 RepID=A0A803PR76_CANSA